MKHKYFFIIVMILALYITWNVMSVCLYVSVDDTKKCDVGIVLGAAADQNGVSEVYKQRLNHAVALYKSDMIDMIIVTGGKAKDNKNSDAYMAKQYLLEEGIPEESVLLEEESVITQENLENSLKIMDDNELETALIISDPLHMKRAMLMAEDSEINAYSSPTKTSAYKSLKTKIPILSRETFFYIGYKWYRLFF
ncbi:MAG: YdcF family protein, partial [Lachnospiraceae bacterium]|nr:YdcF family protein [Lachnospiraceae bacterium]